MKKKNWNPNGRDYEAEDSELQFLLCRYLKGTRRKVIRGGVVEPLASSNWWCYFVHPLESHIPFSQEHLPAQKSHFYSPSVHFFAKSRGASGEYVAMYTSSRLNQAFRNFLFSSLTEAAASTSSEWLQYCRDEGSGNTSILQLASETDNREKNFGVN